VRDDREQQKRPLMDDARLLPFMSCQPRRLALGNTGEAIVELEGVRTEPMALQQAEDSFTMLVVLEGNEGGVLRRLAGEGEMEGVESGFEQETWCR
jgi:hypothetical protein